MTGGKESGRSRREDQFLRGLYEGNRRRALPTTIAWWWRWEFLGLLLIPGLPIALAGLVGRPLAVALPVAAVGAVLTIPPSRVWLGRRLWAIVTPHRLRVGCAELAIHSRSGRLPSVLWTSMTRSGERVWLYCPAGVTIEDFAENSDRLAVTCWAANIQVQAVPGRPYIVRLEVVRIVEVKAGRRTRRP